MNNILISLGYVIFGALVASCALCILYLLLKGLYLSIIKWYYKPHLSSFLIKRKSYQQSLDSSLQCSPNKSLVLNEVTYKCIEQQHDSFDRCTSCSLKYLFEECLSVDCMPEVEGEFTFYKLLKQ
jgi:hypothetical protein